MKLTTRPTPLAVIKSANTEQPKKRLRFNSFGVRLFGTIMGGAILSIASVALLFGETVKIQAEEQIQKILEGKVGTIHEVTDRAETLADSLGISVATLHVRRAETPETYQELTRKLFEKHPDYIVGLGFGQKENGILPSQQWLYPYYQAEPAAPNIRYIDRAAQPYFYPQTAAYQSYFLPQENVWTPPYLGDSQGDSADNSSLLLTYYSQIFDNDNEWIGTAVVDIDGSYLNETIAGPIYRDGGRLILLSESGEVIANPANLDNIEQQTYVDIPGLAEIWPRINVSASDQTSGLIEGESGYWSYNRIPEQSWLVLAYVPYQVVFSQILWISLGTVLSAGLLMAGITALAIRYLNRRLRPVISECQRLSITDEAMDVQLKGKDELEQLSLSFFNLLEQLKLSKTQIQLEAAHATAVETQLSQIKTRSAAQQQHQQQVTQKLVELLPPDTAASAATQPPSPQRLQQELARLNSVVHVLAEEPWLSEAIAKTPDLSASLQDASISNLSELSPSERNAIGDRLNQTFSQVLAALDQFSHLLSAFSQTQDRTLSIEAAMLAANQDITAQTNLVEQLQQSAARIQPLAETLQQQVSQVAEYANSALATRPDAPLSNPAIATFQVTSQRLSEQLQAFSKAIESTHTKAKEYQNITSKAQVLIINASTLAISASRPQSPETLDEIIAQLRSKESALSALAEQLETTQSEQLQSSVDVRALATELSADIAAFDRSAQRFNTALRSMVAAQTQAHSTNLQIHAANNQAIATNQQLVQQIATLCQILQQIKTLTHHTKEQIAASLQQTRQISQLRADVPLALLPKQTDAP
ncbi:MAG: hypothetical protein AAFR12_00925 [Cyanobacteria bacterium J06626_6]